MKLFGKGQGGPGAPAGAQPAFRPIDRNGLLSLLDQVVNGGQSGVLSLREPRGQWTYGFQTGGLTHASGGAVRGARQAFDLLWEFQYGEFQFTPGPPAGLSSNLYIDKSRLIELIRRSQAVMQGPAAPYIAPDQQRPIAPVNPQFQPGAMPTQAWPQPVPGTGWGPPAYPQQATPYPGVAPGYPPGQPGPYPQPQFPQPGGARPVMPGPMPPPMPQQPSFGPPGAALPGQRGPAMPPVSPAFAPGQPVQGQPFQPAMQPGAFPPAPAQGPFPAMPPFPQQSGGMPAPMPAQARPMPSFNVPPMAVPRKKEPAYQPPASTVPPVAPAAPPAPPKPTDELQALRAQLVAQAPVVPAAPNQPTWKIRTSEGTVAPPPPGQPLPGKNGKTKKARKPSKMGKAFEVATIKFLLWACERKYSEDDHWTLKDAFEVSTMELRDQFVGAFSQQFKSTKRADVIDEDEDNLNAGRMRGRGRRH